MTKLMRYQGKLVIDVSERPALAEYGERAPIYQASVRSWHRGGIPFGEGCTKERAIAALAQSLGRTLAELLTDAYINDETV